MALMSKKFEKWARGVGVAAANRLAGEYLTARGLDPLKRGAVDWWLRNRVPMEQIDCAAHISGLKPEEIRPDKKDFFKKLRAA